MSNVNIVIGDCGEMFESWQEKQKTFLSDCSLLFISHIFEILSTDVSLHVTILTKLKSGF